MVHPRLAAILEPHLQRGERLVDASISQIPQLDKAVVAAGAVGGLVGAAIAQRVRTPRGPIRRGNAVSGPVGLTDQRVVLVVGSEVESIPIVDLAAVDLNDAKAVPGLRILTLETPTITRILYLPNDDAKRLASELAKLLPVPVTDGTNPWGPLKSIPVTMLAVGGLLPLLIEGLSDDPESGPLLVGVVLLGLAIGLWWLLFGRRLRRRHRQRAEVRRSNPRPPRPRAGTPYVPPEARPADNPQASSRSVE